MNSIKDGLIPPHGGKLVSPYMDKGQKSMTIEHLKYKDFYRIKLDSLEISDLIMLGIGAFSPLTGFMNSSNYKNVINRMRLSNGLLWPIPITLSVSEEEALKIPEGKKVILTDSESDEILGTISVEEKYRYNKEEEAIKVFGTADSNHPGVKKIYEKGEIYLGGQVMLTSEGIYPEEFPDYSRPYEVRKIFIQKGWKKIAAFQTRNPIHRSHEYITKVILETFEGLFIHPIVGNLKKGDIPAKVRMKCYRTILNYYPKDRVVLKVYPMEMRYAGPKEAILHAIIRQNFGCSHFIVGRDHAGVGNYYGTYDAQNIFDELGIDDLLIKPIKIDQIFWCKKCGQMASVKTCPHSDKDHFSVSGTKLRKMLSESTLPPEYLTRKEVSMILRDYFQSLDM